MTNPSPASRMHHADMAYQSANPNVNSDSCHPGEGDVSRHALEVCANKILSMLEAVGWLSMKDNLERGHALEMIDLATHKAREMVAITERFDMKDTAK